MTFQDIFKSSFLENMTEFSVTDVIIGMTFAVVCGLFIFLIYQKTFSGVMYSAGFALVIMAVTSNVVLSLGMVGALSIVRFRAAIKEPIEIVFLFWAIADGIVIGAGMIPLAVTGSVMTGIVLLIFANRKIHENPYILVLHCKNETAEQAACQILEHAVKRYSVKSKTVNISGIELTAELRMKDTAVSFLNRIQELPDLTQATLVSYNGEYMS